MGIFTIASQHLRFAVKLASAIVLALFVGFHFQLETPRWAVLTAAIVAAGPAFSAGGEPYSGAIRYRGMLRIVGTFIGSVAALVTLCPLYPSAAAAPPLRAVLLAPPTIEPHSRNTTLRSRPPPRT
ncbi:FUSC family protein, partial [Escherichia coli]|uniref:FUSC family protein n=1 Tax=Escherichia coli TaxID=562 RepID=UPI00202FB902